MLYIKNKHFKRITDSVIVFYKGKYSFKIQLVNQVHHPFNQNVLTVFMNHISIQSRRVGIPILCFHRLSHLILYFSFVPVLHLNLWFFFCEIQKRLGIWTCILEILKILKYRENAKLVCYSSNFLCLLILFNIHVYIHTM